MKLKKLAIVCTSVILGSSITGLMPINDMHAQAITMTKKDREEMKYTQKFHKVVILKPIQVYKVHRGFDEAHNRYTKAYILRRGDQATIRARGIAWGWTIGKKYKYCTLNDSYNFSWFEPYAKYNWIDKGLLDNSMKEEHIAYRFNWSQYREIIRLGVLSYSYTTKTWNTKVKPLIKKWHLVPATTSD